MWGFTVLFAGASVAIGLAVLRKPELQHDFPLVIAGLFPLVTLTLLGRAIRKTAQRFRFGKSVLELATFPGVIGGHLLGVVYTPVKLQATDGFDVALSCVQRVITAHGKNQTAHDVVIWHEEQHLVRAAMEQDMTRTAILVGFQIPRECQPSFHAAGSNDIRWKLRVRAKVPGVDYESTFEVPVYVTAESDAQVGAAVDPVAAYRAPEVKRTGPTGKGVAYWKDAAGTVHVRYRAARNLKATLGWCFITVIMVTATCYLWADDPVARGDRARSFGLVSLMLIVICFLLLFQNMEVAADQREVVVTTRYFGWCSRSPGWRGRMPGRADGGESDQRRDDVVCRKLSAAVEEGGWERKRKDGMRGERVGEERSGVGGGADDGGRDPTVE